MAFRASYSSVIDRVAYVILLLQRLAAKDLEDWEQVRVKRLPGEPDGVLE